MSMLTVRDDDGGRDRRSGTPAALRAGLRGLAVSALLYSAAAFPQLPPDPESCTFNGQTNASVDIPFGGQALIDIVITPWPALVCQTINGEGFGCPVELPDDGTDDGVLEDYPLTGEGLGPPGTYVLAFTTVAGSTVCTLTVDILPESQSQPQAQAIPTVSEWGITILSGMLTLGAFFSLRRTRVA